MLMKAVFGDHLSDYSMEALIKKDYFKAELSTKFLNCSTEIPHEGNLKFLKKLIDGEPVEATCIQGVPFLMERYAKLMFITDKLPEYSPSLSRRRLIVYVGSITLEKE